MEHFEDILEVERGERHVFTVHPGTEQPRQLTPDDLSLLVIDSVDKAKELIEKYANTDVPREHTELFKQHLLQRVDSWFVEVSDVGLIYLTNVVPTFTANLQVIFWDKKFGKNRRELVRAVIATGFAEFSLTRVQAFVPVSNGPMANVELKKVGFTHEGTLRKAWRQNSDEDMLVFGLLQPEQNEWQPVAHLRTTTSARRT